MNQSLQKLQNFRKEAYQLLGPAKDATFDLMDAVLTTRKVDSLAELSLSTVFRRKWPSIYETLDDCRPKTNKLMQLYRKQIPTPEPVQRIILAGDHTKSVFNSTINSQVMDCFSLLPAPCSPIPSKQDLVSYPMAED